jgi:WD40 repeat protein
MSSRVETRETGETEGAPRASSAVYDAFLSYSHAADGRLAPALQRGLQSLGKPWYRRRALRVFRDTTSLSASPELWSSIEQDLADSRYFVLLASPEAASSTWVDKEAAWWRNHRSRDQCLIVVTGGTVTWDDTRGDFDIRSDVPPSLRGWFSSEPLWVDLRWARTQDDVSLRNPRFRGDVADVAAPLRGMPKDALVGEDIRQHRRAVRLAWGASTLLVALTLLAAAAAVVAVVLRQRAIEQRDLARSRALAATSDASRSSDPLASLADAAASLAIRRTPEGESALRSSLAFPLRAVLHGPANRVNALAFSPDGRLLAEGGKEEVVRVWDLRSGGPPMSLAGHEEAVNSVSFSAVGRRVLTATGGTVRVWAAGRPSRPRLIQAAPIAGAAIAPDGRSVAVSRYEGDVMIYSLRPGGGSRIIQRGRGVSFFDLQFSRDGRSLLGAGTDGSVRVWSLHGSGRPVAVHVGRLPLASFTPTGSIVTVANGVVRTWSPGGSQLRALRISHWDPDQAVAISPDGRRIAVGTAGGAVVVYDLLGDAPRVIGRHRQGGITAIAFGPNGETVASAGEGDGVVRLWDLSTSPPLVPRGSAELAERAVFARDAPLVAVSDYGTVKVWRLNGGRPRVLRAGGAEVRDLAFTQGARAILDVSDDGVLRLRSLAGGRPRVVRRGLGSLSAAAFSPDHRRVATVDERGVLSVWPTRHGPPVTLSRRARGVSRIVFSPDGRRIATADLVDTRTIKIWDLDGGSAETWAMPDRVTAMAFSPDGARIAAAGLERGVYLLSGPDRAAVLLGRHERAVEDVAFSPTGDEIASGGDDGHLKIWSVDGGRPLDLADDRASVDAVSYNHDGTELATLGEDGELHLWRCLACGSVDRLLAVANRLLPRRPFG